MNPIRFRVWLSVSLAACVAIGLAVWLRSNVASAKRPVTVVPIETIAPFAEHTLGLHLDSYPFGNSPVKTDVFIRANPSWAAPADEIPFVSWFTSQAPDAYQTDHPGRQLFWGLRNGRLVALRIVMPCQAYAGGKSLAEHREEQTQIQDELKKAALGKRPCLNFSDPRYSIHYTATCSTRPSDIIVAMIQIRLAK